MKLSDFKKLEKTTLPSFDGVSVTLNTSLTVGEQRAIANKYPNAQTDQNQASDLSMEILLKSIVEWDLEDDITEESINMLPIADFMHLSQIIAGEKKKD